MVAIAFIGLMGETALAAQTIYFQLSLFIMLFGITISIGNEILVGHLVGAKRFEDAYQRGMKSLKTGFSAPSRLSFCSGCSATTSLTG